MKQPRGGGPITPSFDAAHSETTSFRGIKGDAASASFAQPNRCVSSSLAGLRCAGYASNRVVGPAAPATARLREDPQRVSLVRLDHDSHEGFVVSLLAKERQRGHRLTSGRGRCNRPPSLSLLLAFQQPITARPILSIIAASPLLLPSHTLSPPPRGIMGRSMGTACQNHSSRVPDQGVSVPPSALLPTQRRPSS